MKHEPLLRSFHVTVLSLEVRSCSLRVRRHAFVQVLRLLPEEQSFEFGREGEVTQVDWKLCLVFPGAEGQALTRV